MLTLTRKTDYALIALTHLAQQNDGCTSAREIAGRYEIPLPLLMNVLKLLAQHGLANSVRGPQGGYKLALPPAKINLLDIFQAVEGPIHLVHCVGYQHSHKNSKGQTIPCDRIDCCPVRSTIHRVHARLMQLLKEITLEDIAAGD